MKTPNFYEIDNLIDQFFSQDVIYEPQIAAFVRKVNNQFNSTEQLSYFKKKFSTKYSIYQNIKKGQNFKSKSNFKGNRENKLNKKVKSNDNNILSKEFVKTEKMIYEYNYIETLSFRMLMSSSDVIEKLKTEGVYLNPASKMKNAHFDTFLKLFGEVIYMLMNKNALNNTNLILPEGYGIKKNKKNKKTIRYGFGSSRKNDSVYDKIGSAGGVGKLIYTR